MYSRIDDIIAFIGFGCFISGIYLWLGLPASLMVTGVTLIYVGARLKIEPPLKTEGEKSMELDNLELDHYADNPLWYREGREVER